MIFPIIFGMARFVVNQGDYKYREMLVVIVCLIFLIGAIKYSQRVNLIVVRFQTKKECIQLLLLLNILFVYIYASIFHVSSGVSTVFSERRVTCYSISLILSLPILSHIGYNSFVILVSLVNIFNFKQCD